TYTVCSLDGSSTVGECARRVCAEANVRAPPYSGYALYADDPTQPTPLSTATTSTASVDSTAVVVLKAKDKLLDVCSRWEQATSASAQGCIRHGPMRVHLRRRYHWPHLASGETPVERRFLAVECAGILHKVLMPCAPKLAMEMTALVAQMTSGHYSEDKVTAMLAQFYPVHLRQVADDTELR
ncbi:unnamed protein product, partial [Sphagnum balticum]